MALSGSDILGENLGPGAVREVWVRFPRLLGDVVFTLPFLGTLQARWNDIAKAKGARLRWSAVGQASGAALFAEAETSFIAQSNIEQGREGKPEPLSLRKTWRESPPVAIDTELAHTGAATGRPMVCVIIHSFEWRVAPQRPRVVMLRPLVMALHANQPDLNEVLHGDRVRPGRVLNLLHAFAREDAGGNLGPLLPAR